MQREFGPLMRELSEDCLVVFWFGKVEKSVGKCRRQRENKSYNDWRGFTMDHNDVSSSSNSRKFDSLMIFPKNPILERQR